MTLFLYHSNRLEILAEKLAELVNQHNPDIFQQETILVPGQSMAHWLQLQIAHHNGICANTEFPFLKSYLWQHFLEPLRQVPNVLDPQPDFVPLILTWQILQLLKTKDFVQEIPELEAYLSQKSQDLHLYQLAKRLAKLIDDYMVFRPELMSSWIQGDNPFLEKESRWQMKLWQKLIQKHQTETFPQLLTHFKTMILEEDSATTFPALGKMECLYVFGFSSIPPCYLAMLEMISRLIEICVFFCNPCQEYWTDQYSDKVLLKQSQDIDLAGNSLLRSYGSQNREFLTLLLETTTFQDIDLYPYFEDDSGSLLEQVQTAIQFMEQPQEQQAVCPSDRSIQFHSCYSPMREVEELSQFLLHEFQKTPDLKPYDILVLVPDIETYVPYIQAVFQTCPESNPRYIKATIADRYLVSQHESARAFLRLFKVLGGRMQASELMDLLRLKPVRQKFALSDSDVETGVALVKKAGIRWGIDQESRHYSVKTAFEQNSWDFGLKRLLLGVALNPRDQENFGLFTQTRGPAILPEEEIEEDHARIMGQLSSFVEFIFQAFKTLQEPLRTSTHNSQNQHPVFTSLWWESFLMWLLETFIEESPDMSQGCQLIREVIRQLAMSLVSSGMTDNDTISYEVISSFLQDNLTEYTSKGGFLQGGVTFCRLVPMRSIPAKVICLLGMNEGNFPRQTQKLSFDIMAKYPRPGDREAKKEDRGVFLETLLAVRKLLYISYVGRDIHTRQSLPPSSVVNELMDYLNRHFFLDHTASQNAPLCDHLLTEHPLQPFSRKYFECDPISGEKLHPHLVSYNPQALLLAQERQRQEGERPPQAHFFHPLAQDVLNEIPETFKQPNLEEISTFFRSPCQYFLNKRLNVSFDPIQERNQLQDNEPFALDGLEEFQIKQDLLEHCYLQTRCSTTDLKAKTRAAGILPVGVWGERTYQDISAMIAPLGEHIQNRIQRQHDPFKLTLSFPRLNMTLETELRNMYQIKGTEETAQTLVRPAKEKNKDILWAWLLHLIANSQAARQKASLPPIQTKAFYMDKEITYVPLGEREEDNGPDQAEIFLEQLLTIYLDGLTRPLPFSPKASLTYCTQLSTHPDKAWPMAENAWKPDKYNYEPADSHTIYIFGETLPESEQDRALFCQLAKTVFQPVLRYRQEKNSPLYSR